MITHYSIAWWAERLRTPLSLARFGDGEFLCVQGKRGGNSHGCAYTPELRADLEACLADERITKGMQRILPSQFAQVRSLLTGEWVDTEAWGDAIADGSFAPFFQALRELPVVIVSSAEKRKAPIPYVHFIETPRTNTHAVKDEIVRRVQEYGQPACYLFACGMAAGTIVHALHGTLPGSSFIDIGHILDPFVGEQSRDYLRDVPKKTLERNLT